MPSWKTLVDSKYLKQEDIGPGKLVTLQSIEKVNIAMEDQPAEMKPCARFREMKKPLILNTTNLGLMASSAGSDDIDDWIGRQFVLYVDPTVQYMGKIIGGIRIRRPRKTAKVEPEPELIEAHDDTEPGAADDDIPF